MTTMYQNDWKPGTTFIEEGRPVVLLVLAATAAEVVGGELAVSFCLDVSINQSINQINPSRIELFSLIRITH